MILLVFFSVSNTTVNGQITTSDSVLSIDYCVFTEFSSAYSIVDYSISTGTVTISNSMIFNNSVEYFYNYGAFKQLNYYFNCALNNSFGTCIHLWPSKYQSVSATIHHCSNVDNACVYPDIFGTRSSLTVNNMNYSLNQGTVCMGLDFHGSNFGYRVSYIQVEYGRSGSFFGANTGGNMEYADHSNFIYNNNEYYARNYDGYKGSVRFEHCVFYRNADDRPGVGTLQQCSTDGELITLSRVTFCPMHTRRFTEIKSSSISVFLLVLILALSQ